METGFSTGNADWITLVSQNMIPFAISIFQLYLLFLLGQGLYNKKTWAFWVAGILLVLAIGGATLLYFFIQGFSNTNWGL